MLTNICHLCRLLILYFLKPIKTIKSLSYKSNLRNDLYFLAIVTLILYNIMLLKEYIAIILRTKNLHCHITYAVCMVSLLKLIVSHVTWAILAIGIAHINLKYLHNSDRGCRYIKCNVFVHTQVSNCFGNREFFQEKYG